MLLLCWNVAGRLRRVGEQADLVIGLGADVVCLQEVTPATAGSWRSRLGEAGYDVLAAPLPRVREGSRPLGVLTAARSSLEAVPVEDVPWPERVLAARLPASGGLEVVNVHSPISPKPGLAKVLTHEAVFRHLAAPARHARLVCGDLNTPRREHADGSVWTFARTRHGKLRPERGERWDAAEAGLIRGLEPHGFRDAFRAVHGHELKEVSWEWPRWGGGYRLDHLVVSAEIEVEECHYVHEWRRELRLSDHSPLVARLRLKL
jgi:endonuclease/exonuclease/phosphatase family metal-dependent hydrolase